MAFTEGSSFSTNRIETRAMGRAETEYAPLRPVRSLEQIIIDGDGILHNQFTDTSAELRRIQTINQ